MQAAIRASIATPCLRCIFQSSICAFSTSAIISTERDRFRTDAKRSRPLRKRNTNRKISPWREDRYKGDVEHLLPSERSASVERHLLVDDSKIRGSTFSEPEEQSIKERISSTKDIVGWRKTLEAVNELGRRLDVDPIIASTGLDKDSLRKHFNEFKDSFAVQKPMHLTEYATKRIISALESRNITRMDTAVSLALHNKILTESFTRDDILTQQHVAQLAYPTEWYPGTRKLKRAFHLHVGPTNSGKTYHALRSLEKASTGVYCSPLRLLAHEVYMRLNASGKRCNLITGDDRRSADENPEAPTASCTVEMAPLNWRVDVAVIDEIQMIGDPERGWAWTQAVLGIQADEVHVCGEERAVPIVKQLAALCGDTVEIHRYERLSPLEMMPRSLDGDLKKLEKGDCVVCFSIAWIHALRQRIERLLNVRVAVVYGSLPPETRAQQARLFNDPDNNYDILLASDAVGMGLNLSIKRMIFHSSIKTIGPTVIPLRNHEVKQIAGRAGRFRTAQAHIDESSRESGSDWPKREISIIEPKKQLGLVSTLEDMDYKNIARGFDEDNDPIETAGIIPPAYMIDIFAKLFPVNTPFTFILDRIITVGQTNPRYHMCIGASHMGIANTLDPITELSLTERQILISAPLDTRKRGEAALIRAFGERIASGAPCTVLDIPELKLELLEDNFKVSKEYLHDVEALNKGLVGFLWLSFRFPNVLCNRELAIHVKELTEKRIEDTLAMMSFDYENMQKKREATLRKAEMEAEAEVAAESLDGIENESGDVPQPVLNISRNLIF